MDVRDLRYFASIADSGSINRAAKIVGVSQPALTRAIRVLEQRLGAKLLVRTSKGVSMTPSGQALYVRAKSVIAELSRAEREVAELNRTRAGALTIGVLPSQAMTVLPEAAVRLMKARPDLSLRVVEKLLDDLEAGLRRGEFDFIISLEPRENTDKALAYKVLFYDHPTVVVRRGHSLLGLSRVTLEDLSAYPWVLPPAGTERRTHIEAPFNARGFSIADSVIECHSASFMKKIVMQSDYIGLLQNDSPSQEEQAGLLCAVELEPPLPIRAVGVLYRVDYPLTEAASALVREIQKACIRLGYRKNATPSTGYPSTSGIKSSQ